MKRTADAHAQPPQPAQPQFDLFPVGRHIVDVDPREVIGPRTRVERVIRVRYEDERIMHQVLVDRHGWYCADHGPTCVAVTDAREWAASSKAANT